MQQSPPGDADYTGGIADVYSLIHESRGKDYRAEAEEVLRLAAEHGARPSSLLDIACGTGLHLSAWQERLAHVEGADLSPAMCAETAARLPDVPVHEADMRDLRLERSFDVVTCLFSSIGHLRDVTELASAFETFGAHMAARGVIVVEPWWFPDTFLPGYVSAATIETPDGAISRTSHSTREGVDSIVEVQYLVADRDRGITHLRERHVLTLFTLEEHLDAFESAGLDPGYVPPTSMFDRGLLVARRPST